MSVRKKFAGAIKLLCSLFVSVGLLVTLLGTTIIQGNAQTTGNFEKQRQYEKLAKIIDQKGKVNVLVTFTLDTSLVTESLKRYAKTYGQYFTEFSDKGQTDESIKKPDLPPVFDSFSKPFVEELKRNQFSNFKVSQYSPDVSVEVKSQDELKRLFRIGSPRYYDENTLEDPTLSNSNPVINARGTWNSGVNGGGKNRIIAVLDTGVQKNHPFLAGKVNIEACFSTTGSGATTNCPNGAQTQYGANSAAPCTYTNPCSHGTHVAGIAAGKGPDLTNNYHGVARDADIMALQVFSRFNSTTDCGTTPAPCTKSFRQDQKDALSYVTLGKILQVIFNSTKKIVSANMSLGSASTQTTFCDDNTLKSNIDTLKFLNVATVIAAGNSYSFGVSTPGCISSAITVGAVNNSDVVPGFSNRHPNIDIFAPGVEITSSVPVSVTGSKSGTSMAAPMIAAAFAILNARMPGNTIDTNLKLLKDTGVDISYTNSATTYNAKRLRFCRNYISLGGSWNCLLIVFPIDPIIVKLPGIK
jgi:hypothetical protein